MRLFKFVKMSLSVESNFTGKRSSRSPSGCLVPTSGRTSSSKSAGLYSGIPELPWLLSPTAAAAAVLDWKEGRAAVLVLCLVALATFEWEASGLGLVSQP